MTPYWNVDQLSGYLNIKPATLYAWVRAGKMPAVRLNGVIRFDPRAIEQWLQASAVPTEAPPAPSRPTPRSVQDVDQLIAQAKRAVYTAARG